MHEIEQQEKEKHWDRDIKKEWRKAKRDEQIDERKSDERKKWWRREKCTNDQRKKVKQKKDRKKKCSFLGWFFGEKNEERKGF